MTGSVPEKDLPSVIGPCPQSGAANGPGTSPWAPPSEDVHRAGTRPCSDAYARDRERDGQSTRRPASSPSGEQRSSVRQPGSLSRSSRSSWQNFRGHGTPAVPRPSPTSRRAPGDAANAARAVSHHREPRSSSTSSWPPWAEQTCGAAGPSAVAHRKSVDRTLRDAATPAAQRKPRGAVTGDTPAVVGCRAPRENPRPPARHARNMSPVLPQPTLRLRATEEVVKLAGHSGCRPATSPRARPPQNSHAAT